MKDFVLGFREKYNKEISLKLKKFLNKSSILAVPKLEKIVVSTTTSDVVADSKVFDEMMEEVSYITGQMPRFTCAKKSVSSFKIRQGMKLGCMVTLRGNRMYHFLERLVFLVLPNIREFRGLSMKNFDGSGNITIGIKDRMVFPELSYRSSSKNRGVNITIVTSTKFDLEAKSLLSAFELPFCD